MVMKLLAVLFRGVEIGLWFSIGYYWDKLLWQPILLIGMLAVIFGALDRMFDQAAKAEAKKEKTA